MKTYNILFTLTSIAALVSCGSAESEAPAKKSGPNAVEYLVAKTETIEHRITVPGTVIPFETVELYSEVNGRVKQILFTEGQLVKKGTALVRIDTDIMQAQRKQLQVELDLATNDERRKNKLFESKAISFEQYEQSLSSLNQLKAQLELIDVQISKATIKAPFSGKVGLRNISEGAYVTPTTLITTVAQSDKVKIEFAVAERYAGKIKEGMTVGVTTAEDTTSQSADIYATASSIDQNSRMLTVRAKMNGKDQFYPGRYVNINCNFGKDDQSILVPNSAIVPVMKGQKVWVMKNGQALGVDIQTGVRSATKTQIFGDIQPGDTIITTGLLGMRDGISVTAKTSAK